MALRLNTMILLALAFTAAVVIPEVGQERPIWVAHIPTFLGIDPELQEKLVFGRVRAGEYRARSIFVVSLNYAQYVGLLLPFLLHAMVAAPTVRGRTAAIALLPLVAWATFNTQARTGMVALFVGSLAFAAIWVYRRFKATEKDQDLVSASMLYGFPMAAMVIVSASLLSDRVRVKLLGGSATRASTEGRGEQWDKAIPEILTNPAGHGMGSIERVVPSYNPAGEFTIDSYPINLLVEYGVIGFLAFAGFFILAVYVGLQTYFRAGNREEELSGAAAIGLFTFLVTTTVLSTEINFTIAFLLAGLIVGLAYRQKKRLAEESPAPEVQAPVRSLRLAPLPS
jgi:O-antigen ligase